MASEKISDLTPIAVETSLVGDEAVEVAVDPTNPDESLRSSKSVNLNIMDKYTFKNNAAILNLTTLSASLDGNEKIVIVDDPAGTPVCLSATIANILSYIQQNDFLLVPSIGNYNLGSSGASVDLDTEFGALPNGSRKKVSWYGGTGANSVTFVDNSDTINGITVTAYVGKGIGGFLITKVATDTYYAVPLLGGSIWDRDGGNFTYSWEKHIDNKLYQYGELTSNGTDNNTVTFDITFAAIITYSLQTSGSAGTGTIINRIMLADTVSTSSIVVRAVRTDTGILSATFTGVIAFVAFGTWTLLEPIIS